MKPLIEEDPLFDLLEVVRRKVRLAPPVSRAYFVGTRYIDIRYMNGDHCCRVMAHAGELPDNLIIRANAIAMSLNRPLT